MTVPFEHEFDIGGEVWVKKGEWRGVKASKIIYEIDEIWKK